MNDRNGLVPFLLGATAGSAAALLLAPKSGKEMRTTITNGANKASHEIADLAKRTSETASKGYERTFERAREVVGNTRSATQARRDALREAIAAGAKAYEKELKRAGF